MKCIEIFNRLEEIIPLYKAYSWDNVGLIVGRDDKEVQKIYVALDVTEASIEAAKLWGADLLLTHHPLIFSPLKQVNNRSFISNRVLSLIQSDMTYYAMHTNYDVLRMADLASDLLGLQDREPLEVIGEDSQEGLGRIGVLERDMEIKEFAEYVKSAFGLSSIKVFAQDEKVISKVAILPGSGKSHIETAIQLGADAYVTGDIGHHDGIDSSSRDLVVLDAGHYGVEHIFVSDMCKLLEKEFLDQGIEIKGEAIHHPFQIF